LRSSEDWGSVNNQNPLTATGEYKRKVPDLLLTQKKNIINKKVQGQALGFMAIWVLLLAKLDKKLNDTTITLFVLWDFPYNFSLVWK
jgi:hypothetical protein